MLVRFAIRGRDILVPFFDAREAREPEVFVDDLDCFCESGVRVRAGVGCSVDSEAPGVVATVLFSFAAVE